MPTNRVDYAHKYASLGWYVFPCNGKIPLTPNGFKDAVVDIDKINEMWEAHPLANIGIATGAISRLVVLDVDKKNGGFESMKDIISTYGALGDSVSVATANGGYHFYFEYRLGIRSRNNYAPGVDIKSDGGYVIAPPSTLGDGKIYSWVDGKDYQTSYRMHRNGCIRK